MLIPRTGKVNDAGRPERKSLKDKPQYLLTGAPRKNLAIISVR